MKVTKMDTTYQLSFLANVFPVNCYLVEEKHELTLIDCALPYSNKAILKTAIEIGKPITRIVLTHAHEDHIGALDKLKQALPEARVFISKRDAKLLRGDNSPEEGEENTPIRGAIPKPQSIKTVPDQLLDESDTIGSLQVLLTPGHTPGSISLLDNRNNHLIVGDALQTRGGVAVSGDMRLWFPFPAIATWSKLAALNSARKIKNTEPSLIATGHGKMLKNPNDSLAAAIQRAENKWKEQA
ncbi:MBL fold metallo-hydrolase [Shimazuella sp. AN120528]|uniref:MBL fold metallo-hydrolase n=1 Tax=Shimazuella soli TaxID=1892854 RepID=UPI001F101464|nr:MBL fold metallo-hydrolase [Shimazuella soli]MCH5585358.1 MBL fold metallo-hydrolase [Shimazuella soli]